MILDNRIAYANFICIPRAGGDDPTLLTFAHINAQYSPRRRG